MIPRDLRFLHGGKSRAKKKAPKAPLTCSCLSERVLYPEPDGRHVRAGYQTALVPLPESLPGRRCSSSLCLR